MGYRVAFGRSLALGSSAHYDERYTSWLESWNAQEEGESRLNDVSFESQGLCRTGSNCQSPSYASISRDIDAFLRFRVSTGSGGFSFPWGYSTKASYPGVLKEGVRIGGISCIEDLS